MDYFEFLMWQREQDYLAGKLEPHHSVPAIQERCDIWHDRIIFSRRQIPYSNGYLSMSIRKGIYR